MRSDESAEMYLETILLLLEEGPNVRPVDVARKSGYSKPSVSRAMGLLFNRGMIQYDSNGNIHLTEDGYALASKILDRHRLLTKALMLLGVSEDIAADDACRIEHVISDESIDAIRSKINQSNP
ncbi:MAG: metal-dependent transcriptional regulator [Clostridia bacterium]|nr:metal-dependent transcriptional regulator [Clostridia bacterium]